MSNIELNHLRNRRDRLGRRKIETVSGMDFEPRAVGEYSAANNTIELGRSRMSGRDRITPAPGMDLDDRRTDLRRGFDLRRFGRDEQRDPNAGIGQFSNDTAQG